VSVHSGELGLNLTTFSFIRKGCFHVASRNQLGDALHYLVIAQDLRLPTKVSTDFPSSRRLRTKSVMSATLLG